MSYMLYAYVYAYVYTYVYTTYGYALCDICAYYMYTKYGYTYAIYVNKCILTYIL
ncbi:pE66L [African swine fever virus]|uniref:PE66L n=1 Tax=African swine fever virus TaxID=10497 RepID=A0A894KPC3_ASF|nr:pE66L [African swine fever virus]